MVMKLSSTLAFALVLQLNGIAPCVPFSTAKTQKQPVVHPSSRHHWSNGPRFLSSNNNEQDEDEAKRLKEKADKLKEEIKELESRLGRDSNKAVRPPPSTQTAAPSDLKMSLRNKTVLVVGANGRLGSMVCRYLLRNFPQTEVVAAVHYVGENSPTSRGYGRLSYEVGAEDGVGRIGPAWDAEDRVATFEYTDAMKDYNLRNLRVVEVELLDPVQCQTITRDVDCIVWCATDFNGNAPRAVSGLNIAFLFRAVADPTKGRVEIEGLRNILGGFKNAKQSKRWQETRNSDQDTATNTPDASSSNDPISFILVSTAEEAFSDFETPYGSFKGIKREGEQILQQEFPSISHVILQMSKYEDNFVEENLDVVLDPASTNLEREELSSRSGDKYRRRINRRDAARAAATALIDEKLINKKFEVYTALRG